MRVLRRMIHSTMRVRGPHARNVGMDFTFEDADPAVYFSAWPTQPG